MSETVTRRPARRDYRRVQAESSKRAEGAYAENEVRITAARSQRMYISYAIATLEGTDGKKQHDSVILSAMGAAAYNAVNIAEILKRRVRGLHQTTEIDSQVIRDEYEAVEKGKPNVVHERKVSVITVVLSKKPLDTKHIGYQAPLPDDQVTEQEERPRGERREGGGRGGRGGRRNDDRRDDRRGPREERDGGRGERRDDREGGRGGGRRDGGGRGGRRDDEGRGGRRDDVGRGGRRDDGPRGGRRDDAPRRDDGGRGGRRDDGPRGGRRDDAPRRDDGGRGGRRDEGQRRDDGPRGGPRNDAPRRDDGGRGGRRDDGPRTERGGRGGYSSGRGRGY